MALYYIIQVSIIESGHMQQIQIYQYHIRMSFTCTRTRATRDFHLYRSLGSLDKYTLSLYIPAHKIVRHTLLFKFILNAAHNVCNNKCVLYTSFTINHHHHHKHNENENKHTTHRSVCCLQTYAVCLKRKRKKKSKTKILRIRRIKCV